MWVAGAVLAVLQQSLAGWDALETDLLEAASLTQQAAQLSERVRSATQVVVDSVLELLDAGVFRSFKQSCCKYRKHQLAAELLAVPVIGKPLLVYQSV